MTLTKDSQIMLKEDHKTADTIDLNLINDETLLRMGIESMHNCGLFDKDLDQWEYPSNLDQTSKYFVNHFQDAEEKFNLKKKIHDKKGGIGRAKAEEEIEESEHVNQDHDVNDMSAHLENLATAATQEKDVLERLVGNNEKLAD